MSENSKGYAGNGRAVISLGKYDGRRVVVGPDGKYYGVALPDGSQRDYPNEIRKRISKKPSEKGVVDTSGDNNEGLVKIVEKQ